MYHFVHFLSTSLDRGEYHVTRNQSKRAKDLSASWRIRIRPELDREPSRLSNLIFLSQGFSHVLDKNCASAQKVCTVWNKAFVRVYYVENARRRIWKSIEIDEINSYFFCLHEDGIYVVFDNSCCHIFSHCVENLDEWIRWPITISCWQVPALENEASQIEGTNSSGRLILPSRFFFKVCRALAFFELVDWNLDTQHARFMILLNLPICAVRLQLNPSQLCIFLFEFVYTPMPKAYWLILNVKQVDVDSVLILDICFVFFFSR